MGASSDDANAPYATIARRVGGRLVGRRRLTGGVSADVQALKLVRDADGAELEVVVRRHQVDGWKPLQPAVTSLEYALLEALSPTSIPAPKPLLLDLSGELLPDPYMVLEFIEGTTEVTPDDLDAALAQMAGVLADLHRLDAQALAPEGLERLDDPLPGLRTYLPRDDVRMARLRAWLEAQPPSPVAAPVLVHGDLWPGNVMWRDGALAAVLDWEDAALGDPLVDVAVSRNELHWAYGPEAADAFTAHYARAAGDAPDAQRLALWECFAGAAALEFMGRWGLAAAREAHMRACTWRILERAAAQVVGSVA